jgi:NAD(P)-dependent dehydrogenase (short-subunit alcohol dehydrogenase family)
MELKNKTAIVTGGNSGLGLQIVKELEKKDCRERYLTTNHKIFPFSIL